MRIAFFLSFLIPLVSIAETATDTLWTRTFSAPEITKAALAWEYPTASDTFIQQLLGSGICLEIGAIRESADEGLVTAGYLVRDYDKTRTMFVLKTDVNGRLVWTKFFRRGRLSMASDLWPLKDGGVLAAGTAEMLGDAP